MKKLIGIVPASNNLYKTDFVYEDKYSISNNYITRVKESGGIPIGVLPQGIYIEDENLEIYDGFVMTGGGKIHSYHIQVVDYAIKNNKPFLGICMGMQTLAIYFLLCKEKEKRNYNGNIVKLYEELRKSKYNFTEPVEGHRNAELTYTMDISMPVGILPLDVLKIMQECKEIKSIGLWGWVDDNTIIWFIKFWIYI